MKHDENRQIDPANAPYLQVIDVSKKFGKFTALEEINIDINEGEFVCFLGPSGCGKTTLLRAISGLDIQTYGSIYMNGRDISNLPPAERDFGIVFQSYALFPNLTVEKNIAYGLKNMKQKMKKKKRKEKVAEMLELVGLPGQNDKYPAQLSGGQQQRVALARALATSPGLLLLDEPLSALDAKVRLHLRAELKRLQQKLGITTIMVTHDQEEALTMADRIIILVNGRVEQIGSPFEIYSRPKTAFVADFIGKMNFLNATVNDSGSIRLGELTLQCPGSSMPAGSRVRLAIRPEDLLVEEMAGEENLFEIDIDHLNYMGSCCLAKMSGDALAGNALTGEFSMNMVRRFDLANRRKIRVSLPGDRLLFFPVEE